MNNRLTYTIVGIMALAAMMTMSTTQNANAAWCGYNNDGSWNHNYNCNGDVKIKKANKVKVDNSVQRTCEALCFFWNWDWDWNTNYNTYNTYNNYKHHKH